MSAPVVLLHALATSSAMWSAQRRAFVGAGHQVLTPDQRGYGTTPLGPAGPSLDVAADDLAALLDRQEIGSVALAGASMGGYVAMAFLRRHPGRVRALMLVSTKASADTPAEAAQRRAFASLILDPASRARVVAAAIPTLLGATTRGGRPEVVAAVRGLVENTSPEAIAWSQRAIADRREAFGVLRATNVPSVVVAGEEDELVSLTEAREVADCLPGAELVTVPKAGHLAPMETPGAVTAALAEVLSRAALSPGVRRKA
ncbi:alpha/beta hydrolase [Actinomadura sp. DC4]|uniref:alpha/beta fold hydrolase n=1 Tax=Actinomadura sp. DC4 TaxID=3055069 RepID=UPI0025B1831B|nr:alpha/beta hydrolase [Actinomadura sp. DC4]MDN3352432.1 alpha/beta hydrolase [Actinomadura sp. DC4]